MAESPSNKPMFDEAGDGVVAGSIDQAAAPDVVLTEDGVPVVDLRTAAAEGGVFVVVDGRLLLRLADGTEWPIDPTTADGSVVLQLADQGFVAASAIQAALAGADAALPLATLVAATVQAAGDGSETVADAAGAAEPEAANDAPAHGGGASFRALELLELGPGLDPLLALAPTSLGFGTNQLDDDLEGPAANSPGNGSRFINLAPIANDDFATTSERQSIDIDVLANDRDPNPGDAIRVVAVDAAGLRGIVTLNPDGTINYDPNGQFIHLGVGESATETFGYTIADQHGKTSQATVTVEITGVNDAPIANDDLAVTTEKTAVTIDVLANDVDPDINDELQVVGVDTTGLQGELQFLGDGQFLYDPAGRFDYLGKGQTATETFRYAISDPHGEIDIATVEILIHGVNDAPVANDDIVIVSEKGEVRFDALANDFDPDQGDVIKVANLFSLGGSKGQRWINHDGTITYRPAGAYDYLGEGEYAIQEFGYTITDQHGATATATVTVIIVGVNDAPVANDDKAVTDEKTAVVVNVLANDYDPDINDVIGVVAVDITGLEGNLAYLGDGKFAYDPAGRFDFLGKGQTAVETFRYAVSDQHGAIDIATVEILIHGVNDAPVAVDDKAVTDEKTMVVVDVLANDYDPDVDDIIQVVAVDDAGLQGNLAYLGNGKFAYDPAGRFDHLGKGEYATETFRYAVADQHGAYDVAEVTIKIHGVNDAPVAKDDKAVTDEKTGVVVNVLANDYDPDSNDIFGVVAVDITGLQGNLTYLGDGKFHYDPAGQFDYLGLGHTAVETFRYMISDQHGATDIATVEILIHGVNDAPVAVDDHFVGFATIGFYTPIASLLANDYDVDQGDTFHFAGLGNAVNGQVSLTPDGYVVFTPEAGFIGEAGFQYAIVDQHGAYGIGNVYVDVRPIEPGDMNYMTWTWFSGVSQAEVEVLANGVTLLDLAIEIGAVAGAGLEIGGMPFYSATLAGVLQGVISVAILPDGTPLVTGNLVGDLDMQIQTSPIFAPLGGDVYDALFAAMGGAEQLTLLGGGGGGLPAVPDLGFAAALYDLVEQVAQSIDLSGLDILVAGQGLGDTNAVAFGNGVFYLDISGLISGAIEVPGGHAGQPLIDAEIFGQFAAAAIMDIRDDLTVVSDGFVTGDFDVAVAASGVDAGFAIGSIVSEELALAA